MPVIDGLEATRQIRQRELANPNLEPICIIAMTAEHIASIEPTERSMCRMTITKTMPQAMIATGTV